MDLEYLARMSDRLSLTESEVAAIPRPPLLDAQVEALGADPSVRVASAVWRGAGNDVMVTTSPRARYRPVWWPDDVPFSGPTDDVEHARRLRLTVSLLMRETEMFLALAGVPWMDVTMDSRFRFREWRRSLGGLWAGYRCAGDGDPQSDRAWGETVARRLWVPNGVGAMLMRDLPLEGLSDEELDLLESSQARWGEAVGTEWWTAYPYALASNVMDG